MSDGMNFIKYKKMIDGVTYKTFTLINGLISEEDLYQNFCLTYTESVMYFRGEEGASFSTYLFNNLRNRMNKILIEYNRGDLLRQGSSSTNKHLADNRMAPLKTVVCIYCHSDNNECFFDREDEINGWEEACEMSPEDSFKCKKWVIHRNDTYASEVSLTENLEDEKFNHIENTAILMADCRKFLNEREMRIVRYIIESPEGHLDFMQVCENEGVSHTVIARTLSKLKEKMKIILDKG